MKRKVIFFLILNLLMLILSSCSTEGVDNSSSSDDSHIQEATIVKKETDEDVLKYYFTDESDHAVYDYAAIAEATSIEVFCRKYVAGNLESEELLLKRDLQKNPEFVTGTISVCSFQNEIINLKIMSSNGQSSQTAITELNSEDESNAGIVTCNVSFPERKLVIDDDVPIFVKATATDEDKILTPDEESILKADEADVIVLVFK